MSVFHKIALFMMKNAEKRNKSVLTSALSESIIIYYIYNYFIRRIEMQVTKDSIIGDVLDFNPETAQFFFEIGMHCLGCPSSRGESIEMACAVHGTNADELVKKINEFLAK